jgi:hypothetical protein
MNWKQPWRKNVTMKEAGGTFIVSFKGSQINWENSGTYYVQPWSISFKRSCISLVYFLIAIDPKCFKKQSNLSAPGNSGRWYGVRRVTEPYGSWLTAVRTAIQSQDALSYSFCVLGRPPYSMSPSVHCCFLPSSRFIVVIIKTYPNKHPTN